MTTEAEILINQSVLENRTVRAPHSQDLADALNAHADADCDSSAMQVGEDSAAETYWGETDSGAKWSVRLDIAE